MKRIVLSTLIGVGMVAVIFQLCSGSCAAQTPESYRLVCRGGGSSVLAIAPGERNIGFVFTRGTKPAGKGLDPGECSWVDRGMSAGEPGKLSQHVEGNSSSLKVGGELAPENRWYEELRSADKYWTFMAYNDGRGQLIVTGARSGGIGGMDVSPTANLPTGIGEIKDETPRVVTLKGQAERPSRTEVMKGLSGGRELNVPLAARLMSTDEQIEVLRLAGWKTLDEKLTPYVTLTPQQPYVADRGNLAFGQPHIVDSGSGYFSGLAMWYSAGDTATFPLIADLHFNTKGVYLITFAVNDTSDSDKKPCSSKGECPIFEIELPDHSNDTIQATGIPGTLILPPSTKPQYLIVVLEADTPGWYSFKVSYENKVYRAGVQAAWLFWSCNVTAVK